MGDTRKFKVLLCFVIAVLLGILGFVSFCNVYNDNIQTFSQHKYSVRELSDADFSRTFAELTHDKTIGFEWCLGDGRMRPSGHVIAVEDIPVNDSDTFDFLTNRGTAEYYYEIGDDVGHRVVYD